MTRSVLLAFLFVFLLAANVLLSFLFFAPLSPWFAVLSTLAHCSPIVVVAMYYGYQWLENSAYLNVFSHNLMRPDQVRVAQWVTHFYLQAVLLSSVVAAVFTYNQWADKGLPQKYEAVVHEVDHRTHKHSRTYYVVIENPLPPLLSFVPQSTLQIDVTDEEAKLIDPQRTKISFEVYPGRLGLPWMRARGYRLRELKQQEAVKGEMPSLPALTQPSQEVLAACQWRDAFEVNKEIEAIAPDDYERSSWWGGQPRAVIPLVKGKKHGIEHDTFANGVVYADVPWKHGKKHGTFRLYREDGSLEQRLSYKDGEPYGINQWFDEQGRLTQEYLYLAGGQTMPARVCGAHE